MQAAAKSGISSKAGSPAVHSRARNVIPLRKAVKPVKPVKPQWPPKPPSPVAACSHCILYLTSQTNPSCSCAGRLLALKRSWPPPFARTGGRRGAADRAAAPRTRQMAPGRLPGPDAIAKGRSLFSTYLFSMFLSIVTWFLCVVFTCQFMLMYLLYSFLICPFNVLCMSSVIALFANLPLWQ